MTDVVPAADRDDLWLVLPHLGAGGAQKVALIAARHFAAQGLKVKLVTLIPGHPLAHPLPDGIPWLQLGAPTNSSWWARGGRFALAQLDKLIRGLFQLQLRWFDRWFQARIRPGGAGLALQLFRFGTEASAGLRLRQLRQHFRHERPKRVLALLTVGITSSPALAQLPTMDEPTRGEGSGLMETIQNYLYDAAILGGLIIATVAFYIVGQSALAKYKEASEKGQWGAFGITIVVGIILIVAVIWLATKAAEIL